MTNQRRISLGNPTSPGGATYVIQNLDDLSQMAVEFEYFRLYNNNIIITPRLNARIQDRVKREQILLNHKLSSLGVPEKLKTLLEIRSKSDVTKYCRTLEFSEFELFLLIHNCRQINFSHQSKFPEHIPDDLVITDNDHKNLKKGKVRSLRKLHSLLKFRKRSHVHLFEHEAEWHLFYYTYSEVDTGRESHWKGGTHLHYISHLWTHYAKDEILTLFDQRRSNISGYAHIKFSPFEYPDSLEHQDAPITIFGNQPMLLAINSNLPLDPNSDPVPTAHVMTRGIWISSISIRP